MCELILVFQCHVTITSLVHEAQKVTIFSKNYAQISVMPNTRHPTL